MADNYLESISHLAVEGVIGVGKTSFCNILAARLRARLILEEEENNPFIKEFYQDRERYAFQAQIFFLLSRYRQLSEINQKDLFHNLTITDYLFEKDSLFANINLSEKELILYSDIAEKLKAELIKPDFVVYLQCATDRLLENIRGRNRTYERTIDPDYVEALNEVYNDFFLHYDETPLLIIDATDIDFVNNPDDLQDVLAEINRGVTGTRFYKPIRGGKR